MKSANSHLPVVPKTFRKLVNSSALFAAFLASYLLLTNTLECDFNSRTNARIHLGEQSDFGLRSMHLEDRCLVIVLAETRAHELTWSNFEKHVLNYLKADLALAIGERPPPRPSYDPFKNRAKYIWIYEEPDDWGTSYDEIAQFYNVTEDWKQIFQIKTRDGWLGGIKASRQLGSAGILLYFRWFLMQKLIENDLLKIYGRFIITRSDFYYLAPHPPMHVLNASHIWCPEGEDYGGISDRHFVIPSRFIVPVLNVLGPIIQNPKEFVANASRHPWGLGNAWKGPDNYNLEQMLKLHLMTHNLWDMVQRFSRPMFTVRNENTTTRWSKGKYDASVGMIVKYPEELPAARDTAKIYCTYAIC